jgi:hypothetical protein
MTHQWSLGAIPAFGRLYRPEILIRIKKEWPDANWSPLGWLAIGELLLMVSAIEALARTTGAISATDRIGVGHAG